MSLAQLPSSTIKLIGSSQIITSVSSVVKELVENSIDSGASHIEIKLLKHGLEKIEVKDNGYGIEKSDAALICLPSYTSKIADISDLDNLSTYGFRGEALSALCNVAEVCVTTKTAHDEVATCYTYDHSGQITCSMVSHITRGTIVSVTELFKNLPVRKQFISNSKKATEELNKVEQIVKCLAMIHPRLRINVIHNKFLIWQKNSVNNLRQSVMQVIAPSIVKQLHHILHNMEQMGIEMLVPRRDCDVPSLCYSNFSDAYFIFINRRYTQSKEIWKTVYDKLIEFFGVYVPVNKYPVSVLSLTLPGDFLDVNLEPNKTQIYFKHQDDVLDMIKQCMQLYYGDHERATDKDKLPTKKSTKKRKIECDILEADSEKLLLQNDSKPGSSEDSEVLKISNSNKVAVEKSYDITDRQINSSTKLKHNVSLAEQSKSSLCQSKIMKTTTENNPAIKPFTGFNGLHVESNVANIENLQTSDFFERDFCTQEKNLTNLKTDISMYCLKSTEKHKQQTTDSQKEEVNSDCHVLNVSHNKSSPNIRNAEDSSEYLLSPVKNKCCAVIPHSQLTSCDCNDEIVTLSKNTETPGPCSRTVEICDGISQPTLSQWSRGELISSASSVVGSSHLKNSPAVLTPSSLETLSNRSVSSQMGCKELSAFTIFARNIRKQILNDRPDLGFTKVAQQLQACWKQQSSEEKDTAKAENMARVTNIFSKKSPGTEIEVNMKSLKEMVKHSMKGDEPKVDLIGHLEASFLWLHCTKNSGIVVFSIHRLKEAVKFYQNLIDYSLPIRLLENGISFSSKAVGSEEWKILLALERSANGVVTDSRLLNNGFLVEITEDEEKANLTYVPQNISYCGVEELQEILSLLKNHGSQASLIECRPLKVISFIRSEVMRECSQEELLTNPMEITQLFSYWLNCVAPKCQSCIHYLPVTYFLDVL